MKCSICGEELQTRLLGNNYILATQIVPTSKGYEYCYSEVKLREIVIYEERICYNCGYYNIQQILKGVEYE